MNKTFFCIVFSMFFAVNSFTQQLAFRSAEGYGKYSKGCRGWLKLKSTDAPNDSDHDEMPDKWEDENNLNKDNPEDRNNLSADGYTMLEKYLNSLK